MFEINSVGNTNAEVITMEIYRDNFNNRLQQLNEEEAKWENYLNNNAASLTDDEIEKAKNTLAGIRSEKGEINQIVYGGFY